MLVEILEIQDAVNEKAIALNRPTIDILNQEEINYIHLCHKNRVFPRGWTGSEFRGDELLPQIYPDGTVQPLLW
jgi:DNA sulfur modification protein DndC